MSVVHFKNYLMPEERNWLTVAKGEEAKDNSLLDSDAGGD